MRQARDRRSGQVQTADSPAKINHIQTLQVFLQSGKKYKGKKEVECLKRRTSSSASTTRSWLRIE